MHRNPIWIGFLIIITSIAAFYIIKAGINLYDYNQLDATTTATEQHFKVKQVALDAYAPIAHFNFLARGKEYSGSAEMGDLFAANPEYIENRVPKLPPLKIYYSSKNPDINALDHDWPFGSIVKAALMFALTLYFFWLGTYVKQL